MNEKILTVFSLLYQKHYKKKYKPSKNDNTEKFLLEMRSKGIDVGKDFIKTYMLFQYDYYFNMDQITQEIRLQWLVSPKAVQRYLTRDTGFDWCVGKRLLVKLDINKDAILYEKRVLKKEDFIRIDPVEELIKSNNPFPNTIRGVVYCMEQTTMYHAESKVCQECKLSQLCKAEQKITRILTYTYRGNGAN